MKELIATTTQKIESPKAKVAKVVEKHAKMADKELKEAKPKKAPKEAKPKAEPYKRDKAFWYEAIKRHGAHEYAKSKGVDLMKYKKDVLMSMSLNSKFPIHPPAYYNGLHQGGDWKKDYEFIPKEFQPAR
jgi:hypothetical protein